MKESRVKETSVSREVQDGEIDLMLFLGRIWEHRVLIFVITFVVTLIGVLHATIATPIYRAQALVQIETREGGAPGLDELTGLFVSESEAVTEIELIRSRMVLGETVNQLNLNVVATPNYFPLIGKAIYRRFKGAQDQFAEPLIGGFVWGGEDIEIKQFEVPELYSGEEFTLSIVDSDRFHLAHGDEIVLKGEVGQLIENSDFSIQLSLLTGAPGTKFFVRHLPPLQTINQLSRDLKVTEKGKNSGILNLVLDGEDPKQIQQILNTVMQVYVLKNVARNAAEADKSLEFLKGQLPQVKFQLEEAEKILNDFQVSAQSVNITTETEALLNQIVAIEEQMSELQLKEVEVKRLYRPSHPTYLSLLDQMEELKFRRDDYQNQIKGLPETQQKLLRLNRDVEVNTQIYTQMLNNIQELDIVRAGTIGNVRIVDEAEVNRFEPVKPRKVLIVLLAAMIGGMFSILYLLFVSALRKGVENPEDIEKLGIPVFAAIPYSADQERIEKLLSRKYRTEKQNVSGMLLSIKNPTDISIEAIRSLRTSIHFAMVEAKNNVIMITGPSPTVGKSFVSSNLSAVIAQSGQRVVIVDADMRKGFIHKLFYLSKNKGLADYLSGQLSYEDLVKPSAYPNLSLVTHGTTPPNPSELLMNSRFNELVDKLSADFDLVLIDTPPIMAVTDAALVGRSAGTTMLVTRYQLNPLKEIEISIRRLEQNGVEVKGVIFNAIQRKNSGYGYNYGYYTYDYGKEK